MTSVLDRLLERPAATDSYTVAHDPGDAKKLEPLYNAVLTARNEQPGTGTARTVAQRRVNDAEKAYRAAVEQIVTVTLNLQAIGPAAYEQLVAEHPPTQEQVDRARANAEANQVDPDRYGVVEWNVDTFPPALLAASCEGFVFSDEPDVTGTFPDVDATAKFWGQLAQGDQIGLLFACQALNRRSSHIEHLGKD